MHREICRWAGVNPVTLPHKWPNQDTTPYADNGLSYRANRCLSRAGIPPTKTAVRHALITGALSPGKRPANYGKQTHAEICRWTGIDRATLLPTAL